MTDPAPTVSRTARRAVSDEQPDVAAWLRQCGSCDAGLPMSCTCPDGDPRAVIAALAAALSSARAENERHEVFMRAISECRDDPASAIARNDIINGKALIRAYDVEQDNDRLRAENAALHESLNAPPGIAGHWTRRRRRWQPSRRRCCKAGRHLRSERATHSPLLLLPSPPRAPHARTQRSARPYSR